LIKVLIVDDHQLMRIGLKKLLSDVDGIEVIGEAESGEDAIRMVKEKKPHVVLMVTSWRPRISHQRLQYR